MELDRQLELEILNHLNKNKDGLTCDQLFEVCTLAPERLDMARALHFMAQQVSIYKKNNKYFLTCSAEERASATTKVRVHSIIERPTRTAPKAPVHTIPPKIVYTSPPGPLMLRNKPAPSTNASPRLQAKASTLPMGNLRRAPATGFVAMVLWRYKNEDYSIPLSRILDAIGQKPSSIYVSLTNLIDLGYLVKFGSGRQATYKWAGKYQYPFSEVRDSDAHIVKILPKSERTSTEVLSAVPVAKYAPKEPAVSHPGIIVQELGRIPDVVSGKHKEPNAHVSKYLEKLIGNSDTPPFPSGSQVALDTQLLSLLDTQIEVAQYHLAALTALRDKINPTAMQKQTVANA